MTLTLAEMQARAAFNPALVLVSCTKVEIGTEPDGTTKIYRTDYNNPPANFKLDCDPVEEVPGEIWAVLEDLDYVAP